MRARLQDEIGTVRKEAAFRVALAYPSPYRAAMSSLGYQSVYRLINEDGRWAADRAILPDDPNAFAQTKVPFVTYEREKPVGEYPIIAFSVAYELEIAGLIQCLELAGIPPLAADRGENHPVIVAGGPLTFSNPIPLAPFIDVAIMGEAEELTIPLLDTIMESDSGRDTLFQQLSKEPGIYVPRVHGDAMPPVAKAGSAFLPARSQIITPHTELSSMFMTEAARGCSRGCTYCVMRRSTNGGMRIIPAEQVLAGIPNEAKRVGLVGAAVTDHPKIAHIVRQIVDSGRQIGISSLRSDKLNDELVGLLAKGGYRTLTIAGDGASQKMRNFIERRTTEEHLIRSTELGKKHGIRTIKMYMMLGIPGETDNDVDELSRFCLELQKIHPRVALGLAPFVAKRNTPLDGEAFAGIRVVEDRIKRLRKGLKGKVVVRPTSARWAWVEYMLAQGTSKAGLAVLTAHRNGASFGAYKKAFAEHGCEPTGPVARVPSTSELIALKKRRMARQVQG